MPVIKPQDSPFRRDGRLSPKHMAAVNAYMTNGFNQREAIKTAGYADSVMGNTGMVFLRPDVKREIAKRMNKATETAVEKHKVTVERVLDGLLKITNQPALLAKFAVKNLDGSLAYDFTEATQEDLEVIGLVEAEVTRTGNKMKIKPGDVLGAWMAIGRHLGMFTDKVEISGESLVERLARGRARAAEMVNGKDEVEASGGVPAVEWQPADIQPEGEA